MERAAYEEMHALEDHHWWFRGKRRMVAPLLEQALGGGEGKVLLDVGCGTGGNLAFVERRFPGLATCGLDVDAGALRYCRERGPHARLIQGEGGRLPFGDTSLSCVLALDVIEHVDDDRALLAEFRRVLEPGGVLVASVPAYPSLWSEHDEALHHKRRYKHGELQRLLVEAGFVVERSQGFNFLLLPPIALVRWWSSRRPRRVHRGDEPGTDFFELPRPLNALLTGLFAVEEWITRVVRVPFGVSLMVRAQRG
ncbi:MAG: class I SAM-dependent methyltransferase [Planctomycetota bacterium]|nr:class I SAM-dependent methyltransferase [Planctomycetota bacterium]